MAEEVRERTLRDVAIGDKAVVKRLVGSGAIKRHIMDMGITKGTEVFVRKDFVTKRNIFGKPVRTVTPVLDVSLSTLRT